MAPSLPSYEVEKLLVYKKQIHQDVDVSSGYSFSIHNIAFSSENQSYTSENITKQF